MLALIVLPAILLTSFISGMMGMAGGMILMGLLALMLPIVPAMLLHGATQLASNGSRAWIHRKHIQWQILPGYLLGAFISLGLFLSFQFVAPKPIVFLSLGLFPVVALLLPKNLSLELHRFHNTVLCGALVTGTQLIAGASGPVLDVFYFKTRLNRYQVIASKALTQTLGHAMKIGYYTTLLSTVTVTDNSLDWWLFPMAAGMASLGSYLGKKALKQFSDVHFQRASRFLILGISFFYVYKGLSLI